MENQENTTQAGGQGTIIGLQYWSDLHDPSRNIERNFDYTTTATFRCVTVGNTKHNQLTEGKLYLVYRKHEQTGEPTYSLCVHRDGCWIPYGIDHILNNLPGFTGIPVTDTDYWIEVGALFQNVDTPAEEPEKPETQGPEEEPEIDEVHAYVERRLYEMENKCTERYSKINRRLGIMMGYIHSLKDDVANGHGAVRNGEYLKTITDELLDRVIRLEEKLSCMPHQYVPPITAYPIITYSIPGVLPGEIPMASLPHKCSTNCDKSAINDY